jgi:hypothetical protein
MEELRIVMEKNRVKKHNEAIFSIFFWVAKYAKIKKGDITITHLKNIDLSRYKKKMLIKYINKKIANAFCRSLCVFSFSIDK